MENHEKRIRFLAGVLAAGGVFWGFWSVVVIRLSDSSHRILTLLIFLPGLIVTAGYVLRCFYTPSLYWRRLIWGISAVIQGAWMVPAVSIAIFTAPWVIMHPCLLWWIAAFIISI